jgi:TRAP-type C4-dicarboxylate transport system substrate-binding protein
MKLLIWYGSMAILAIGVYVLGAATNATTPEHVWHMPTAYPASNYQSQTAEFFAQKVFDCTGGALEIVVHPGGSLFKGHEIKRAVRTRQVPIGERLLSVHSNENQLFAVDSIPFAAGSFEEAHQLWNLAMPAMQGLLDSENLLFLYSVIWPPQGIYFRDEVLTLAEVRGMKFRAYNATTARVAELAGMIPVQIEAAEMSQALATGVVSSFMASGSSGYDSKVWEHVDYFYNVRAWMPRNSVFANKDAFAELPIDIQTCIRDSARLAESRGNLKAVEMAAWYLEQLLAEGKRVEQPAPRFAAELYKIGQTLSDEWVAATGDTGRRILSEFDASKKAE